MNEEWICGESVLEGHSGSLGPGGAFGESVLERKDLGVPRRLPDLVADSSRFTSSPAPSSSQTERAYQKQPTIFQNKKRVLLGETAKEKLPRYYKNIGLGFKTPKEVGGLSEERVSPTCAPAELPCPPLRGCSRGCWEL